MFLLVPAYPGCPGSKAMKRSLLLLLLYYWTGQYLTEPENSVHMNSKVRLTGAFHTFVVIWIDADFFLFS